MPEFRFSCPHCAATLRLRDRHLLGREIGCPDCDQTLVIVDDGRGELTGVVPALSAAVPTAALPGALKKKKARPPLIPPTPAPAAPGRGRSLAVWLGNPVAIAWVVAAVFTTLFIVAIWPDSKPAQSNDAVSTETVGVTSEQPVEEQPVAPAVPSAHEVLEQRMRQLGGQLLAYREEQQHFPTGRYYVDGVPLDDRFSWIAELALRSEPALAPHFHPHLSWRAPENERFIRRPQPWLLNPLLEMQTGEHGYPATHFVGVAGLGADAPQLDVKHPRAGVFGINRKTKLEDITDGAGQTIMLAGVREQLGSWSSPGPSTVRPFTREPYVNGPDGFSTGSPDQMFVVMADGSVRSVSRDVSPLVFRRMVTIAEGVPLEAPEQVAPPAPAEPETPEEPVVAAKPEAQPVPEETPLPPAPELPAIEIAARLEQRIASYHIDQPRSVQALLDEVSEMLGVTIEIAQAVPADQLQREVSFSLKDTTVGDILKTLADRAELEFDIRKRDIYLRPPRQATTAKAGAGGL